MSDKKKASPHISRETLRTEMISTSCCCWLGCNYIYMGLEGRRWMQTGMCGVFGWGKFVLLTIRWWAMGITTVQNQRPNVRNGTIANSRWWRTVGLERELAGTEDRTASDKYYVSRVPDFMHSRRLTRTYLHELCMRWCLWFRVYHLLPKATKLSARACKSIQGPNKFSGNGNVNICICDIHTWCFGDSLSSLLVTMCEVWNSLG